MVEIRLKKRYRKRKAEEISEFQDQEIAEVFFPDEIIINILSRLPAENAIRCRLVCRRWRDLASTHAFRELQLQMRSSIPMIFVAIDGPVSSNFLLDKWWGHKQTNLVYHRFVAESKDAGRSRSNDYLGKFSHGGLVVFEGLQSSEVIILNPTSHKNVEITLSKELRGSEIYGVFFNPTLEEYCTLWRLDLGGKVHYKMLNLGSKPCWREISNPWSHRVKKEGMCPVLIDEHLYWLVSSEQQYSCTCQGDIMEFNIRSEKFDMMHCPVPLDVNCTVFSDINLLDIDGALSFVLTSRNYLLLNVSMWKLKDRAWLSINHISILDCLNGPVPMAKVVVGEELVLRSDARLYVCNPELQAMRTFLKEGPHVHSFSHVMSLASLKHCKSKIFINKKGEVGEESDMA